MVTVGSRATARAGFAALLCVTAACTQVLGIEEARVDPALSGMNPKASSGAAGGSSTGGSGGAASTSAGSSGAANTGGSAGQGGHVHGEGDADGSTSPDGGSAVCMQYCADIMSFCTGNVKQYIDNAQCLKVCALYPEGTVGGSDGNTAACRMKYAGKARYAAGSERDAYCRKSGPGSDGTCGVICEGFCTLMMPTCTRETTSPYFFLSSEACMSTCQALRDTPPYTVSDGTLPDTNDAQCRLFHVTSAVMDPDEHCEHAMGVTMCDSKNDAGSDR